MDHSLHLLSYSDRTSWKQSKMGREAILTPKINSYSFCLSTGVLRHGKWHCTTVPPTVLVHDITEIFLEMLMETRHWPNPSPAPNDIQGCGDCTHVSTFRHYSLYTVNTSMLAKAVTCDPKVFRFTALWVYLPGLWIQSGIWTTYLTIPYTQFSWVFCMLQAAHRTVFGHPKHIYDSCSSSKSALNTGGLAL